MSGNNNKEKTTLVMKFGGTSVGSVESMSQAAQIVKDSKGKWQDVIVVTSALSKVTDALLACASHAVEGDKAFLREKAEELRLRHHEMIKAVVSDAAKQAEVSQEIDQLVMHFVQLGEAIAVLGEATPRALDAIVGFGERMSVRILAAAIESAGVPARFVESTEIIITDDNYQYATPNWKITNQRVKDVVSPLLEEGIVPVVTGFLGATPEGIPTTLGRGGSDYSAAIWGVALKADEVWIWTDVNGVMTADPRLVPNARTIPALSFLEISELAYYGAKVLHPKTIRPVVEHEIGLRVLNTFNPAHEGTEIVAASSPQVEGTIKAVTIVHNQSLVTLEGRGMLGVPGVAAKTFGAVAGTGASVTLITQASSEQSICFAVPIEAAPRVVTALEDKFKLELTRRNIDRVWASEAVSIVTVVGAGMRNTPGIAGNIFSAMGTKGLNVIAIAQGSSEVSISLVVDEKDAEATGQVLHALINGFK